MVPWFIETNEFAFALWSTSLDRAKKVKKRKKRRQERKDKITQ